MTTTYKLDALTTRNFFITHVFIRLHKCFAECLLPVNIGTIYIVNLFDELERICIQTSTVHTPGNILYYFSLGRTLYFFFGFNLCRILPSLCVVIGSSHLPKEGKNSHKLPHEHKHKEHLDHQFSCPIRDVPLNQL